MHQQKKIINELVIIIETVPYIPDVWIYKTGIGIAYRERKE